MPGSFDTVVQLLAIIKRTIRLPHFPFRELKSSGKYEILFIKYEGITFPGEEIPSIIGFKGIPDSNGIHIGYKMIPKASRFMKSDDTKAYYGEFPADLCAGKHLICIYTNIIGYQYVGDTRAPFLRIIDSKHCLKNCRFCELEPTHRMVYTNLDYKNLLTKTNQSISTKMKTETGQLVPLFANWKSYSNTLMQKKFPLIMLIKQRLCLTFLDIIAKKRRGFGALAAGIGRVALPLASRFILTTAKRIGKGLLKQNVPEILDVVGNKRSPKQRLKIQSQNFQKTDRGISTKYFTSEEFHTSQATESNQQTQRNLFNAQSS